MTNVTNSYGKQIDYETAVAAMDKYVFEQVANWYDPITEQEFFDRYAQRHYETFGSEWKLDKQNPQY